MPFPSDSKTWRDAAAPFREAIAQGDPDQWERCFCGKNGSYAIDGPFNRCTDHVETAVAEGFRVHAIYTGRPGVQAWEAWENVVDEEEVAS